MANAYTCFTKIVLLQCLIPKKLIALDYQYLTVSSVINSIISATC